MKLKKAEITGSISPFVRTSKRELVDIYRYVVQFDILLKDLAGFASTYKLPEDINNARKES